MDIFAFIPARYTSSRFPGKPLASIRGKPMIRHVYERVASCPEISRVYVATDDERISACVAEFGGYAVLTGDHHASGTDRVCEAAEKSGITTDDLIVNVQGDQPLFHPSNVSLLVRPFFEGNITDISTLKWKIEDRADRSNPNCVKVVTDKRGFALYFSRSPVPFFRDRDVEEICYKHLGVYAYRMGTLRRFTSLRESYLESAEKLEQLRALENGFTIRVIETPHNSIDVDVPEDIGRVEAALLENAHPRR